MQLHGINNNSALQTLQSLVTTLENDIQSATTGGQNVPSGSAGTASLTPSSPPPPPPFGFSNQFAPSSLAFLTQLQSTNGAGATSSISATALSGLGQGLSDLNSALKEIQAALSGTAQTSSAATASLSGSSLTASATATTTTTSTSLTSSVLASVLSELSTVLNDLGSAGNTQSHHHHHHHHDFASNDPTSANSTTSSTTSTSVSATLEVSASNDPANTTTG